MCRALKNSYQHFHLKLQGISGNGSMVVSDSSSYVCNRSIMISALCTNNHTDLFNHDAHSRADMLTISNERLIMNRLKSLNI